MYVDVHQDAGVFGRTAVQTHPGWSAGRLVELHAVFSCNYCEAKVRVNFCITLDATTRSFVHDFARVSNTAKCLIKCFSEVCIAGEFGIVVKYVD